MLVKASAKTPVERAAEMVRQRLDLPTIALCLNVSEVHAERLVRLAKREMQTSEAEVRRMQRLPEMLENARRKVAALEAEAKRTGRHDLLREDAA